MGKKKEVTTLLTTLDKTTVDSLTEEEKFAALKAINKRRKAVLKDEKSFKAYKITTHLLSSDEKSFKCVNCTLASSVSVQLVNLTWRTDLTSLHGGYPAYAGDKSRSQKDDINLYPDHFGDDPSSRPWLMRQSWSETNCRVLFVRKEHMTSELVQRLVQEINDRNIEEVSTSNGILLRSEKELKKVMENIKEDSEFLKKFSTDIASVEDLNAKITAVTPVEEIEVKTSETPEDRKEEAK